MEKLARLLKTLAAAYLIGRCWRCAEVLDKLSSGRGGRAEAREAYELARELWLSSVEISGVRCCAAEPLGVALDEYLCRIYGGIPLGRLCCAPCGEMPSGEEVLEVLDEVEAHPDLAVRAAAEAQAPR